MLKRYAPVLLAIVILNFFLPRLMPGDPFLYLSVEDGQVSAAFSPEQIESYKAYYGLDRPLPVQFGDYLLRLCRLDLGFSIYFNAPVLALIASRIPWTVLIVLSSLFLSAASGIFLGAESALRRGSAADLALFSAMTLLSEIPAFLTGVFLLFAFGAALRWFPLAGALTPFAAHPSAISALADLLSHAALPVAALALSRLGEFYVLARASLMTVLSKDYIDTARAKGLSRRRVLFVHAFRNALPPIAARVFMSLGGLFGGAVLVENVFAYPGVGRLMREAVLVRDYVLIQGVFFVVAVLVLATNALSDAVHRRLDPRIAEHG